MTIVRGEKFADAVEVIVKTLASASEQEDIKHKLLTGELNLSKKDIIELSALPKRQILAVLTGKKLLWIIKADHNKHKKDTQLQNTKTNRQNQYNGLCNKNPTLLRGVLTQKAPSLNYSLAPFLEYSDYRCT